MKCESPPAAHTCHPRHSVALMAAKNTSIAGLGNDWHTLAITWQPQEPLNQGGGACRATLAEEHTLILYTSGGPASIMAVFDHCIYHG
ncbi:hypothetical protein E2C01_033064 [Portunus trituberculatus]|uniref:Uncharacterized protein n=1 Tax=Portunus trituberculatus TaxID=210409 RepID=A0A5B7F206_PORTR|nr:hypothetical protein [Portunus trituberculatus]